MGLSEYQQLTDQTFCFIYQATEVERLCTWYNPIRNPELVIEQEEEIVNWLLQLKNDRWWRENARLAWNISPHLACHLTQR